MTSFEQAKADFQKEIQDLYAKRDVAFQCQDFRKAGTISKKIDERVIKWNEEFPKGPTYLDLHWMTRKGAVRYVQDSISGKRGKWLLETGRGNHSPDNMPVIKTALLEVYGEMEGGFIVEHRWNKGILILSIL